MALWRHWLFWVMPETSLLFTCFSGLACKIHLFSKSKSSVFFSFFSSLGWFDSWIFDLVSIYWFCDSVVIFYRISLSLSLSPPLFGCHYFFWINLLSDLNGYVSDFLFLTLVWLLRNRGNKGNFQFYVYVLWKKKQKKKKNPLMGYSCIRHNWVNIQNISFVYFLAFSRQSNVISRMWVVCNFIYILFSVFFVRCLLMVLTPFGLSIL